MPPFSTFLKHLAPSPCQKNSMYCTATQGATFYYREINNFRTLCKKSKVIFLIWFKEISTCERLKHFSLTKSGNHILRWRLLVCACEEKNMPVLLCLSDWRLQKLSILYKSLKLLSSCSTSSAISTFISFHSRSSRALSALWSKWRLSYLKLAF